jgi:hypothetical protein
MRTEPFCHAPKLQVGLCTLRPRACKVVPDSMGGPSPMVLVLSGRLKADTRYHGLLR